MCGIEFTVGVEIEFSLYDLKKKQPVDYSTFANTTTINVQDEFITELYDSCVDQEIDIELIHSESSPGQIEIVLQYTSDVVQLVDNVILARETIVNVARKHHLKALFLPKIHESKAGNGMHVHLAFREVQNTDQNNKNNAFADSNVAGGISREGKSFIEGILRHLPSLLALTLPTNNSFKRVGVGCWTGHTVSWAYDDKESPMRVCVDYRTGVATNVEYKLMDSTSNPYLAIACILSCGLEGIANKLILRQPSSPISIPGFRDDDNISSSSSEPLPSTLIESLARLRDDVFLLEHVMGSKLSNAYLAVREEENNRSISMTLEKEVEEALLP